MASTETVLKLKNDFLFKAVYGSDTEESKFILKNLLNKILDREDDPIVNIEYKNPFQLKEYIDDKETILDIKAEADSKELIDIEMQIVWSKDMISRLLAYHGALLREALQGEKDYVKMKQTVTICITDTNVFNNTNDFLSKFYFMEKDKHFIFTRHTRIYCIELPKVNAERRPVSELTPLETCLEYLKYATSQEDDYVKELIHKAGKELEMTEAILKKATSEDLLREKAIAREKYLNDQMYWSHRYDHGYDDGFNEGFSDGFSDGFNDGFSDGFNDGFSDGFSDGFNDGFGKGSHTAIVNMAKAMKSNGIPFEIISKCTKLTIETIEKL